MKINLRNEIDTLVWKQKEMIVHFKASDADMCVSQILIVRPQYRVLNMRPHQRLKISAPSLETEYVNK